MVRTARKFPKNWENVKPISTVVENTRFIVFKTPIDLDPGLKFPRSKRFTTQKLLYDLTMSGHQLGMIIDLCFTSKYYDATIFEGVCSYKHIYCCPAGYTRREDIVKRFITTVDNFLNRNKDNNFLIGVHCSDGINRSGYLICRYLIDKLHLGSDAALDAFEKARGHTIERGSCIQALHRAVAERRNKEQVSPEREAEEEKQSKKRKAANPVGGNDVLQQLAALEQHFSMPKTESFGESPIPMQIEPDNRPLNIGPRMMPKRRKEDVEEGEFYEEEDEYEEIETVNELGEISLSKKRRERRKRLEKKFNVMKSGKFHLIQEILKNDAERK